MTLGKKIKQLRTAQGFSQEALAAKLNVSRSAVAKWETDGGIPEVDNLLQLASVFGISLDELIGNAKKQTNNEVLDTAYFKNQRYDIELTGWNDGVYGVYLVAEDTSFLYYYQPTNKTTGIYGMLGKKYISSLLPVDEDKAEKPYIEEISKNFFYGKPVKIELAKKEGLIRGFLDFRDDAYRNTVICSFEADKLHLQFGGALDINAITKIEELND